MAVEREDTPPGIRRPSSVGTAMARPPGPDRPASSANAGGPHRSPVAGHPSPVAPPQGLSLRALVIGLLLVPLNVYWVIVAELRWYIVLTLNPLFVTPVFTLFVLALLNAAIRRAAPRFTLTRSELVVVYVMLVMSCTVATHDFLINLMSTIGWAGWYATPENGWEATLFPHLPRWLLVWDRDLLEGYFKGHGSLYSLPVLRMWLAPLAFWSLFVFTIGWIMLCLATLLRRAWTDQTRLSFPVVRLPIALTDGFSAGSMLRSRALWIGFAVAAGISLVNGLREWFPTLPHFPTGVQWLAFPTSPWSAAGRISLTLYPYAIGLAFLVPLDVSFSCWFFYLFPKLQLVAGFLLGYGGVPDFPYVSEQGIGAWVAFGVMLLYSSRRALGAVVRTALSKGMGDDADEPLPYRVAFWGLVVGSGVFFIFWWAAGMKPVWALLALVAYLLVSLCITRARAEAGGQHTVWDLEPLRLFRLFDSQSLGPGTLGAAAVSHWYWRLNRSHPMPSQMEAFKLAQEQGVRLRAMALPLMAAFVLATVVGLWACLHVLYQDGALAKCQGFALWAGNESYNWLNTSLTAGFKPEKARWGAVGAASGLVVLLTWLRGRFAGFPFHPLGYCIGPGLIWHWFPFFVAWLCKLLVLRFGGLGFYRRALPFFLGLVLGDYVMGALWTLIGIWFGVKPYQFQFF